MKYLLLTLSLLATPAYAQYYGNSQMYDIQAMQQQQDQMRQVQEQQAQQQQLEYQRQQLEQARQQQSQYRTYGQ